jgi:hypothetical protein
LLYLEWEFGVIQREMVGRTLCERVGSFLDSLSSADKERMERRISGGNDEPNLKLAIDSLIRVGTYYQGTNEVIAQALSKDGLQGEKLQAEVDRITLKAALRFYGTFDPRLIRIILQEIVKGFYPTNDQGIALTGPKATYYSVADIEKGPGAWTGLRSLLFFETPVAQATLERALHDNIIRHWRFLPIAVWCLFFAMIGGWRMARGKLSADLAIVAACIFGIGLVDLREFLLNRLCSAAAASLPGGAKPGPRRSHRERCTPKRALALLRGNDAAPRSAWRARVLRQCLRSADIFRRLSVPPPRHGKRQRAAQVRSHTVGMEWTGSVCRTMDRLSP